MWFCDDFLKIILIHHTRRLNMCFCLNKDWNCFQANQHPFSKTVIFWQLFDGSSKLYLKGKWIRIQFNVLKWTLWSENVWIYLVVLDEFPWRLPQEFHKGANNGLPSCFNRHCFNRQKDTCVESTIWIPLSIHVVNRSNIKLHTKLWYAEGITLNCDRLIHFRVTVCIWNFDRQSWFTHIHTQTYVSLQMQNRKRLAG